MAPKFDPNETKIIIVRAVGGEVGATSTLAPKVGPLGLNAKKIGLHESLTATPMSSSPSSIRPLRVCVLAMDSLDDYTELDESLRTYEGLYSAWFVRSGVKATFSSFRCFEGIYPSDTALDQFDLFMLTGSRYAVYDQTPWVLRALEFVRRLDQEKRRILGICFGHQLVAHALQGKVTKNPKGEEEGCADFAWTPAATAEFGLSPDTADASLPLLYSHGDAVVKVPPDFISMGSNAMTMCQGLLKDHRIVTYQGHPEFTVPVMAAIIARGARVWAADYTAAARKSLLQPARDVRALELALRYLGLGYGLSVDSKAS
jgi:GMP synthase (glutamine-hydrolysing)